MAAENGVLWFGGRLILCRATVWGTKSVIVGLNIGEQGPAVFDVAGRGNDERIFRSAVRHSRSVRILRLAIPLGVVLSVAAVGVYAVVIKPLRVLAKIPVDIGSLVVSGTKITMQQPRIAGFTSDQRQYELTAQAAARDISKPDLIELQGIHATMEMKDKVTFNTTALNGLYDTKSEMLTLEKNVLVKASNGFQARLAEAIVDIRNGKIVSDKPVEVKSADWLVSSNRMEVSESGDVVRFDRGVSVILEAENPGTRVDARVRTR